MKRIITLIAAAALCLGAAAQSIRSISDVDILVEINADGSAWITQRWSADAGPDGTEFYIPIGNLGPMTIGQLSVEENGESFESQGDKWDVDRSRSWKTGKCGIVRKRDGVELCWGLGATGKHEWNARFLATGLVQAYDDADAFNFQFVNLGMKPAPKHARVTIVPAFECPEWTTENTRIWAFGFYGEIGLEDGQVVAETTEKMDADCSVIVLCSFEKGIFQPAVEKGGPVQTLIDRAMEGNTYQQEYADDEDDSDFDGEFLLAILSILGIGCYGTYARVAKKRGYKWKKSIFGQTKIDGWYRDIPLEGNIFAAQYLLSKGQRFLGSGEEKNLIGALFLRWIMHGYVSAQPDPKNDKRVNLGFVPDKEPEEAVERELFRMAKEAAGDNNLLEKGEFERWSKRHTSRIADWPDRATNAGRRWFVNKGYLVSGNFTHQGSEKARQLVQFQNFLKDFTLSDQRDAGEVKLWKDYLVYAQLFGIADKVAAQFKKLYPKEFEQLTQETGMNPVTFLYAMSWANSMSSHSYASVQAYNTAKSGGGGHSSFGGGGGFSGGGFGGGGR